MTSNEPTTYKQCAYCQELKPVTEFRRRTGKGSAPGARRGACRSCRSRLRNLAAAVAGTTTDLEQALPGEDTPAEHRAADGAVEAERKRLSRLGDDADSPRRHSTGPAAGSLSRLPDKEAGPVPRVSHRSSAAPHDPADASVLRPNRQGTIRMRGRTDRGRGWQQEIDLELAVTLVREKAAVVVNPHTIRRLYTSKGFRRYILNRDNHTCYFCGGPGDTIDHLLPRAKGGHTTPDNCVCACNLCNQLKADQDAEEFLKKPSQI